MSESINDPETNSNFNAKDQHKKKGNSVLLTLSLAFKSIGIVFGDIGTSPLY
ncbi:8386_t:CDS:2, partial [Racocetra persica]